MTLYANCSARRENDLSFLRAAILRDVTVVMVQTVPPMTESASVSVKRVKCQIYPMAVDHQDAIAISTAD